MAVATIARPKTATPRTAVARKAGRDDSDLKLDSSRRMTWIEEGGIDLRGARADAAMKAARRKKASQSKAKVKAKAKARPKARAKPRSASRAKTRRSKRR